MNIKLSDEYRLDYDGMGYTLLNMAETENKKTGEKKTGWKVEGYYGTIAQSVEGAYRHKIHKTALDTIEELKRLQIDFTHQITALVKAVEDSSGDVEEDE